MSAIVAALRHDSPPRVRRAAALVGAGPGAGVGLTAYAACEARAYTLRRVDVPVLPRGQRPLRVLHLSDVHMTPGQRRKQEWLRGLAALRPDLVVNTGDNLAHRESVPVVLDALGPLLDVPGVFVFGSNDYFSPTPAQPAALPAARRRHPPHRHPAAALARPARRSSATAGGSTSPTGPGALERAATSFAFAGVDDPHLEYDRLDDGGRTGRRRAPTSGWASPTRRTCGCSTSSPPTGTTR